MSLATNISSAFTRVGTECKSIRTLVNGNQATLAALTTTAKGSLVQAINELDAAIDSIIASGSATNLDALTDVTLTGVGSGHILRYNGSVWVNVLGTTHFEAAGAAAAAQAASQPLDADLTALAALAGQTAYGRNFLTLADQNALIALLPGYQPLDADLTAIAALAGQTAYGRSFLTMADAAAMRSLINVDPAGAAAAAQAASQPLDSDLTSIAALATTAYGRSLLTPADAAAARALLGVVAADDSDAKPSVRWATTMGTDIETNGLVLTNAQALAAFGGSTNATTDFPVNTRLLIKNDGTTKWNGIYVVTANSGSTVTFARASDMDSWSKVPGAFTWVEGSGLAGNSVLYGTGWVVQANSTGVINSQGMNWIQFSDIDTGAKQVVRAATTANITLSGTQTVDTVTLAVNERVLVKSQSTPANNGIYTVQSGAWIRATDCDQSSEVYGAMVTVKEGGQSGTIWATTFKQGDVINTAPMNWYKVALAGLDAAAGGSGSEISNGDFEQWTDPTHPVGWSVSGSGAGFTQGTGGNAISGTYSALASGGGGGGTFWSSRVIVSPGQRVEFSGMLKNTAVAPEQPQAYVRWNGTTQDYASLWTCPPNTTVLQQVSGMTSPAPASALYAEIVINIPNGSYLDNFAVHVQRVPVSSWEWAKEPVVAVATSNITLPTASQSGLDSVTLAAATMLYQRVLLTAQTNPAENGIYYITAVSAGVSFTLTRAPDADSATECAGAEVAVKSGGTYGGTNWVTNFKSTDTLGSTAMVWAQPLTTASQGNGDVTGPLSDLQLAPGVVDITAINTALKPSGSAADASEALRALGFTAKTAMPGVARLDQIAVPTAAVNMNGQKITGVANTPTVGTDAVNKNYADGLLAANDAMVFKGGIDCSTNPPYPAADAGHVYRVTVAGKIGGAAGPNVEMNDTLTCLVDASLSSTHASVGANWLITQTNIDGAVTGPAASTAGNLASFSGATGKVIQDAGAAISTDGTLAANSNAKIPTEAAVKTYAQPYDADLLAIAGLASAANKLPYATGTNNWAMTDLSVFGRSLIAAADATAARAAGILDVYSRTEIGDPTTDFVTVFNAALV